MADEHNSEGIAQDVPEEKAGGRDADDCLATKDEVVIRYTSGSEEEAKQDVPGAGLIKPNLDFSAPKAEKEKEAKPEPAAEVADDVDPSDFFGMAMRSYNKMRAGDKEAAWAWALRALEMGTEEPDLYIPLCQQFEPAQRRELADAAMKKTPPTHDAFQWLWVEVALSYWYERNYSEAVAEYETILMQKNLDPGLISVIVNGLAMSLEAVGRHAEAEEKYLEVGNQEAAVRARMRSGDLAGAAEMMKKGIGPAEPRVRAGLEGTIACLRGNLLPDLSERIEGLLDIEQDFVYKDFMLGMMYVVSQQVELGHACLCRFVDVCGRNPNEWGVTLSWEITTAEDVLKMLAESYGM